MVAARLDQTPYQELEANEPAEQTSLPRRDPFALVRVGHWPTGGVLLPFWHSAGLVAERSDTARRFDRQQIFRSAQAAGPLHWRHHQRADSRSSARQVPLGFSEAC